MRLANGTRKIPFGSSASDAPIRSLVSVKGPTFGGATRHLIRLICVLRAVSRRFSNCVPAYRDACTPQRIGNIRRSKIDRACSPYTISNPKIAGRINRFRAARANKSQSREYPLKVVAKMLSGFGKRAFTLWRSCDPGLGPVIIGSRLASQSFEGPGLRAKSPGDSVTSTDVSISASRSP